MNTKLQIYHSGNNIRKFLLRREMGLLYGLIVCLAALIYVSGDTFFHETSLTIFMLSIAGDGFIVIGITLVLISGGIDLSVGALLSLAVVLIGKGYSHWGLGIWTASLLAIMICGIFGLINGLLIGKMRINPFIVTLGIAGVARGLASVLSAKYAIVLSEVPPAFSYIGHGSIAGIPVFFVILIILVVVLEFLIRKTTLFQNLFYTGSNEKAAILSGIRTSSVKIVVYIVSSLLVGIVGVFSLAKLSIASPTLGNNLEFRYISAAIIGGASLNGGEGSITCSFLGLLILTIINKIFLLTSSALFWQDLISGLALLIAVLIDFISHRHKK